MIAILIQLLMFFTPTISAVTLAMKYDEQKRSSTSKTWPVAKGTITESTIEASNKKYKGRTLFYPEVTLAYEVEGKTYTTKERPSGKDGGLPPRRRIPTTKSPRARSVPPASE